MRRVLAIAALVVSAFAEGRLPDAEWRKASAQANRLLRTPGRMSDTEDVIATLARDDGRRAAKLLVRWARASLKRQEGPLQRDVEETKDKFRKVDDQMRKQFGSTPPPQPDFDAWFAKKQAYRTALRRWQDESQVQAFIGAAFGRLGNAGALALIDDPKSQSGQRIRASRPLREAWVSELVERKASAQIPRLLAFAADADLPRARLRILEYVRHRKLAEGFSAAVQCLSAEETVVKRAAVATLRALDRFEAVKPLIACLDGASGLLCEELEAALYYFTGARLGPFADVWDRWWTREGAALTERGSSRRFTDQPKRAKPRGASFYGIATRSNRIVFVLDRSGSMRGAKIEAAKDELARTIRRLSPDVRFGVVFFNHEVETWWKPPLLAEARNNTKRVAIEWIMNVPAHGRTHMFQALRTALWYAEIGASDADTVFLLSDGAPTQGGGPLAGEELEREYREFVDANRFSRCVVHTIGIGPDHDRQLMRRIAHDTGGTYRAVGGD